VARDGTVYVSTNNGTARGDRGPSHVFAHDAHGARTGDRTISGQPADHANGLTGVAVDPVTGHVAVLQPDGARVLDVDMASGTQAVLAEIPDIPACLVSLGARPCQSGAEDRKPFPIAAAYDGSGNLFFTDPAQDTVWRLRRGARSPDAWYQSMDFAAGDGPYGLALRPGAVEFTVGTSLEPSNLAGGGLYRVAFDADGNAAARTVVATFPRGDEPGPLALGSSGTAYVVLRGTGAIVAITPAGFEAWRIRPPGNGPIPLDSPSALALVPGRLLVANGSNDPARWAVLAVAVDDGPGQ
jgi:DNA-binding beta-propeller fold protein YncE